MEAACSARHAATALPGAETVACSGLAEVPAGLGRCRNPERIQPLRSTETRHGDREKGAELGARLQWRWLLVGSHWPALPMHLGQGSCLESACAPAEQAPGWLESLGSNKDRGWALTEGRCWAKCLSYIPTLPGPFLHCRPEAASLRGKGRTTSQEPSGVSKDLSPKAWT